MPGNGHRNKGKTVTPLVEAREDDVDGKLSGPFWGVLAKGPYRARSSPRLNRRY